MTVIILGNLYNGVPTPIGRDLIALTLGENVEPVPIRRERPDPAHLAELVGTYQFGPDFYRPNGQVRFWVKDGHLFNGESWIIPTGDLKFIHRTYWSDLEFKRDESGRIAKLQYDKFVGQKQE